MSESENSFHPLESLYRLRNATLWLAVAAASGVAMQLLPGPKPSPGSEHGAALLLLLLSVFSAATAAFEFVGARGTVRIMQSLAAVGMLMLGIFAISELPPLYFIALAALFVLVRLEVRKQQAAIEREKKELRQREARQRASAKAASPAPAAAGQASAVVRQRIMRAIAYVKHADLPDLPEGHQLKLKLTQNGAAVPDDELPVARASKGVFGVFYVIDEGGSFSFVNGRELRESGLMLEQLHTIGLKNLTTLVSGTPGLQTHLMPNACGLIMGGNFEASLVLLDELWDGPLKAQAPNGAVVTVPARDICTLCDAASREGIAQLRDIAARVTQGGDHLVSKSLYLRKDGRWQKLEGAAA